MDEKTAKKPDSQMLALAGLILDTWLLRKQLGHQRKLHRLAGPAHSGVSAPAERPRDADAEAGGQRPADAEAGGHRSAARAGGQRRIRFGVRIRRS